MRGGQTQSPRAFAVLLVLLVTAASTAASPPNASPSVFRLRVPSSRVHDWFPPGTELKGMSADAFDRLVRSALAGAARRAGPSSPRILKATHSARWQDGLLVGRSRFVIESPEEGTRAVALSPWTPAVDGLAQGTVEVRSDDAGQTLLRVTRGPRGDPVTATVEWQLRSRPGSSGRKFALGLPEVDASSLSLDLPAGWEPEGPSGLRTGPASSGAPGRSGWMFVGRLGAGELLLVGPEGDSTALSTPVVVEGSTRVDLGEASANWTLAWSVNGGRRIDRPLVLLLDKGLSILNVSGPGVEDFRSEPADGGSTRLTVRLARTGEGATTTVTVHAKADAPSEGPWLVPSARPVNAVWTGGRTTVRYDASRVLAGVNLLAGRRVEPPPRESGEERRLDFEAERPSPVAELVLRRPEADVSAELTGRLVVGANAPRLSCRIVWRIDRGRLSGLALDLPRSWFAERVEIEGQAEPPVWHPEVRADGSVRLHVSSPSGELPGGTVVLNVEATAAVAGGRGPLALPRVRLVGVRLVDELWVACGEPGMTLLPTQARGLAWIDPATIKPVTQPPGATIDAPPAALAWRWTDGDGEARIERGWSESSPRGTVELVATVSAGRLAIRARVVIRSKNEPLRSVLLGLNEPAAGSSSWRVTDEATGLVLPRTPVARSATDPPASRGRGPWWRFDLPRSQYGRVALEARYEGPWEGTGRVPLVLLPSSFRPRGTALILAARDVRTSLVTSGVTTLDPAVIADSLSMDFALNGEPPSTLGTNGPRRVHALAYSGPEAALELRTEVLANDFGSGVIREAVLTDNVTPEGDAGTSRLVLKIVPDRAAELKVILPAGAALEKVHRDGLAVAPTVSGETLAIPLGGGSPSPNRPPVVVTLDYRLTIANRSDRTRVLPVRPRFSMPCLSLSWELIVPERWSVASWGAALNPDDPALAEPGLIARLTGGKTSWVLSRTRWLLASPAGSGESRRSEAFRDLDERVAADHIEEISLGEWLTRLDAGREPLIVDRTALLKAGWEPRSRITPPHGEPAHPVSAREAFRSLGMSAARVGPAVLLSTLEDVPPFLSDDSTAAHSKRVRWESALREAVVWGSDASDRFQSIARWRETSAPRAAPATEAAPPEPRGVGRTVHRFVAVGWPESRVEVRLVDRRAQTSWCWTIALGVCTVGVWSRRRFSPAVRAAAIAAMLGLGLSAAALVPPWFAGAARGLTAGTLALALFSLGRALPKVPGWPRRAPRIILRLRRRASGSGLTTPAIVLLVVSGVTAPWASAQDRKQAPPAKNEPILALYPYEGPPDPSRALDRVLLRLSDYERLRSLADESSAPTLATIVATGAKHRVVRRGEESALVESELALLAEGQGPVRWTFPVGEARSITVAIDGVEVPVKVEADGASASVAINLDAKETGKETAFRLKLRRFVLLRRLDGGEAIRLPVNSVAASQVEVGAHPAGRPALIANARGRIETHGGDAGPSGWLGPVNQLDVRWPAPAGNRPLEASGTVEGLYLWDALAAGDRVRARLTYRNSEGTPVVRIALEPRAIVSDFQIPGSVDVSIEGTSDRPEWVARINPPLPDRSTVALDVWRPRADPSSRSTGEEAHPLVRRMPRVEPLHVEKSSAVLAFRRPADWLGRIAPGAGAEALGEELFVRSWGSLPTEALTLSGAVRVAGWLGRNAPPAVEIGPGASRSTVVSSLSLTVSAGRIGVSLDAELSEAGETVHEASMSIPDGLRLDRVSADGLTFWERTVAGTLRLRFDGPAARSRKVWVRGGITAAGNPLTAAPPSREIEVPWPRWPGRQEQPGTLTVVSPTRFKLLGVEGDATPRPVASTASSTATGAPVRLTYRVDRPEALGKLRWEVEPPRVAVFVRSQLTLNPESAEWFADLRYEISGGPLEEINLRLPADWARHASVWLEGIGLQQISETRGESTFWTLRPERPVWGTQRVVVRSTAPFPLGSSRAFPELKPRGWGEADTSLRLVNATRGPVTPEAKGVREVNPQVLAPDDELALATPRAAEVTTYHVIRSDWSLRVLRPGSPEDGQANPDVPRVSRAELDCDFGADGSVVGVGRYHVGSPAGSLLPMHLAPGSLPVWVTVNGNPVRPLNAGPGRWLVPLPEKPFARVGLVWQAEPSSVPAGGRIALPVVGGGRIPSVVTVRVPEGVRVQGIPGGLAPASPERLDLEVAGWLIGETAATLAALDRSSRRDAEDFVADVVRFESRLRQANRAASSDAPGATPSQRSNRIEEVRLASTRLRARLAEAAHDEVLDEYLDAARVHLGLAPRNASTPMEAAPDPVSPVQSRALGRPVAFLGELVGTDPGRASLLWSVRRDDVSGDDRLVWIALGTLTFAGPPLAWLAARGTRSSRTIARLVLVSGLALSGFWGGPSWLAASLGFVLLGRVSQPHY